MSANNPIVDSYYQLLKNVGRATLSNIYPNDFEYYMCSFELVDSNGKTVDFLVFPVNPNSIKEREMFDSDIQRTALGIVTNDNSTFIPVEINISGNFGRKLKMLIGRAGIDAVGINFSTEGNDIKVFSNQIKTGYGTSKVLDNILKKSRKTDNKGNQYRLYFYNQGFGTAYLVKVLDKEFNQDLSTNMIWNYNISLLGIAPINSFTKSNNSKSLKELCTKSIITKGIDITYNAAKSLLK